MSAPERLSCIAGGLFTSYLHWDLGGPELVLLLHGWLDQAASFGPLVRAMRAQGLDGVTVVAPDLRGHGHTSWVGAGGAYHFPDYVRDVVDLLDHLETVHGVARPATVVGHSMGGSVTAYLAGAFPDRVARLALVEGLGPPSHPITDAPELLRAWIDRTHRVERRGVRPLPSVEAAAERLRAGNHRLDEQTALELAREGTRTLPGGEVVWRFDPRHRTPSAIPFEWRRLEVFLERIVCPALVVYGEASGKPGDVEARIATVPGARHLVIEGAGHMVHQDRPDALAEQLLAFLAEG